MRTTCPYCGNPVPVHLTSAGVTMAPHQIISLLDLGGATLALPDHADHIHVGFAPAVHNVFRPGQWTALLDRLREIDNPVVPTRPHGEKP